MPTETICDRCHRLIAPGEQYIVKIEILADPEPPAMRRDEIQSTDYREEMRRLLALMENSTPRELQDDVYRRFEFRLCRPCQQRYLENPLPAD